MSQDAAHPVPVVAFTPLWEYECCGTPLVVGDVIDLTTEQSDVAAMLHTPHGLQVTRYHGRHWSEVSRTVAVRGRVVALWEVREPFGEPSGPVLSGWERTHEVDAMRFPSEMEDPPLVGWLIELLPFDTHGQG